MPTRSDHATAADQTTTPPLGATTGRSVRVAVAAAVLALVAIALWLTVSGPEAGISPAAEAESPATSDAEDVPEETLVRNRGVFE